MKFPTVRQLAAMDDDALLAHLASLADELDDVNPRQAALWEARIAVYREGRRREPAITNSRLADAARVSEVAIITKLKQLDDRKEAAETR